MPPSPDSSGTRRVGTRAHAVRASPFFTGRNIPNRGACNNGVAGRKVSSDAFPYVST
jgi:hypothetical protein